MKKCAKCGLLNDDSAEACNGCGCTVFKEKPPQGHQADENPVRSVLFPEKKGRMVILKCRTPAEALLVRQTLESEEVIATLPHQEEMMQQCRKQGYVEVTIPADVYYSNPDLRSIVEYPNSADGISARKKLVAFLLGFFIFPGLIGLIGLLLGYRGRAQERKSSQLILWFFVGVGALVLVIAALWNLLKVINHF